MPAPFGIWLVSYPQDLSCKKTQEADILGMNPEELPRPKGPKVKPIDWRQ
jgi:hypothetical protein